MKKSEPTPVVPTPETSIPKPPPVQAVVPPAVEQAAPAIEQEAAPNPEPVDNELEAPELLVSHQEEPPTAEARRQLVRIESVDLLQSDNGTT